MKNTVSKIVVVLVVLFALFSVGVVVGPSICRANLERVWEQHAVEDAAAEQRSSAYMMKQDAEDAKEDEDWAKGMEFLRRSHLTPEERAKLPPIGPLSNGRELK